MAEENKYDFSKSIPLAIEDKFVIFGFNKKLCADSDDVDAIRDAFSRFRGPLKGLKPIFDLRQVNDIYNDIQYFIKSFVNNDATIIVDPSYVEDQELCSYELSKHNLLKADGLQFPCHSIDLNIYGADDLQEAESNFTHRAIRHYSKYPGIEYADIIDKASCFRAEGLESYLTGLQKNSLLSQIALAYDGNKFSLNAYHSKATYDVRLNGSDEVICAKPSVLASRTCAVLSREMYEFEKLLNKKRFRESDFQKLFKIYPNFLKNLNYSNVYPQLIMQREDGSYLEPDFFLEPYQGGYCDILDLKLPDKQLFSGRDNRIQLAHAVTSAAAQLREYAAYFEQDKYRKLFEKKYGLKVYKPKLTVVIGRGLGSNFSEEQVRATTEYSDFKILTFDELLEHSKRRILI